MKHWIPAVIIAVAVAGCGDLLNEEDTKKEEKKLDADLIGSWELSDEDEAVILGFFSPDSYKIYLIDISEGCELLATGTAYTSKGEIIFTRQTGQVTSSACLLFFLGTATDNDDPTTYSVNSDVSLTIGSSTSQLTLLAVSFNWNTVPIATTVPYLHKELHTVNGLISRISQR